MQSTVEFDTLGSLAFTETRNFIALLFGDVREHFCELSGP
jgi:hypothetical protein